MIDLSSVGNGRKIGAVRFHQQAVKRSCGGRFLGFCRVFIGNNAGEGNVPAQLDQLLYHFGASAVAVENARHLGMTADYVHAVAVSLAVVNDHGIACFLGQTHQRFKVFLLDLGGYGVPVIIKTDLSDGNRFRMGKKSLDRGNGGIAILVKSILGMNAHGGIKGRILISQIKTDPRAFHVSAHVYNVSNTACKRGRNGTVHATLVFLGEPIVVIMCVCIKNVHVTICKSMPFIANAWSICNEWLFVLLY